LAETGSVSEACARVGLSRNSAQKLRGQSKAESFAAACDAALGMPVRKVTIEDLEFLAYHGPAPAHSLANGFFGLRMVSRTGTAPKPRSLRIELTR